LFSNLGESQSGAYKELSNGDLFDIIKEIIIQSRFKGISGSKLTLPESYWQIRKLIVQDEQNGKSRVDYGKKTLKIAAAYA